jgi:hypothetical protein
VGLSVLLIGIQGVARLAGVPLSLGARNMERQ